MVVTGIDGMCFEFVLASFIAYACWCFGVMVVTGIDGLCMVFVITQAFNFACLCIGLNGVTVEPAVAPA